MKRTILFGLLFVICIVEARQKKGKIQVFARLKRDAASDGVNGTHYEGIIQQTVNQYVADFAKKNKVELLWHDINGVQGEAIQNNASKLELQMSPMKFEPGQAKGEGKRDDGVVLYTNIFCNAQKRQNISAIISKTLNRTATFSWKLDESKFAGLDLELDLQVPEELNNMAEFSTTANLKDTTHMEASTVDTFNVQDQVNVGPKTVTKAIWILSERKMTFPFWIEATLKGDVAMKSKTPFEGKTLFIHPIKSIMSVKAPEFKLGPDGELVLIMKGQFSGIRGLATNLRTKSHKLKNTPCQNSAKLFLKQS